MVVTRVPSTNDGGQQAGAHHLSVDQHAARAADADAAALLGARQPEVVAQQVDQAAVGADGYFTRGSVELRSARHAGLPSSPAYATYPADMSITAQRVRSWSRRWRTRTRAPTTVTRNFRVNKKIFATLSEAEDRAALRLTSVEARALAERAPETFRLVSDREPVTWVSALLASADEAEFTDLLEEAWSLRMSEKPAPRAKSTRAGRR